MAKASIWIPIALGWEGTPEQWASIPANQYDRGGVTRYGVTWKGFAQYAARIGLAATQTAFGQLSAQQAYAIAEKGYWADMKGDGIQSQAVANMIADWFWGSGGYGIQRVQRVLNQHYNAGLVIDGGVGPLTLAAINRAPADRLLLQLRDARIAHAKEIAAADPSQLAFLKGWINRIQDVYNRSLAFVTKKK